MRGAAMLVLLGACGRVGFDARVDASAERPDGTIPTNDGSVDLSCIAQLDAGFQHACVRATDGRVWCWGRSDSMQLGDGFTGTRNYPARAPAFVTPTSIALGGYHTCQINGTGSLACFGANYLGQLGIGAAGAAQATLQDVSTALPSQVAQVATGEEHTCARLVDGRVYCWGRNFDGECGDGTNMQRSAPVFTGITNAIHIVAGNHHNCAITVPDDIVCWGDNQFGQIGDGTMMDRRSPTSTGFAGQQLIAAGDHTCIVNTSDQITCWGYNGNGQLGINSTTNSPLPVAPQGFLQVAKLALGYKHTCVVTTADELYCWGQNLYGQIGNSSLVDVLVPTRIVSSSLTTVTEVAAGWDFTCAVDQTSALSCWGANDQGQLGDATNDPFSIPKPSLFSCDIL